MAQRSDGRWDQSMSSGVSRRGVLVEWRRPPLGRPEPRLHRHEGIEVIYCQAGEGVIHVAGVNHRVRPGEILTFPAVLPHGRFMTSNYTRWNLCFSPVEARVPTTYMKRFCHSPIDGADRRWADDVFEGLAGAVGSGIAQVTPRMSSLIEQLVALVHCRAKGTSSHIATMPNGYHHEALLELLNHIDDHLQDDLSVNSLAKELAYSPSQIWRLVRTATDTPPMQYINSRRLAKARRLLLYTDQPIATVAETVGFASASYFSRIFGLHIGTSPREYRTQHRRAQ